MYHLIEGDSREAAREYWCAESGDALASVFDILKQALLAAGGKEKVPFTLSLLSQAPAADDSHAIEAYLSGQRLLQFSEESRLSQRRQGFCRSS